MGARVDKTRVEREGGDGDHFCRFLEKAILEGTGYAVQLAVKEHLSCLQLVSKACPNPDKLIQPSDHMLLKAGNCIPCALGAVLGIDLLFGKLTDAGQAMGTSHQEKYGRTARWLLWPVAHCPLQRPGAGVRQRGAGWCTPSWQANPTASP